MEFQSGFDHHHFIIFVFFFFQVRHVLLQQGVRGRAEGKEKTGGHRRQVSKRGNCKRVFDNLGTLFQEEIYY